jgi:hypothetical protein
MASQAYYNWVSDGKPKRFSRPITAIADRLQEHGYTVYQEGNQAHLTHEPPEDHTFFSATGWPGKSPYPYCNAMDIMPPDAGQKSKLTGERLPSLQLLSAQLYADKQAKHPGVAFLKYMNSEPAGNNTGPCYHDSWTPDHSRINSTDRGHIHISGRSDSVTSTLSDDYDLVARVTGDDMAAVDLTPDAVTAVKNAVLGVLGSSGPTAGQDIESLETFPAKFAEILAAVQAINTPTVDVNALADAIVARLPQGTLTKQDVADVLNSGVFTP